MPLEELIANFHLGILAVWSCLCALALYTLWALRHIDRGCPNCSHCQAENRRREERRKEEAVRNLRWMGVAQDEIDKRLGKGKVNEDEEARATRERLFGRSVVDVEPAEEEPSVAGSSGDQDGGGDQPD